MGRPRSRAGSAGGAAHPGGAGAHGDPAPGRTVPPDPPGGFSLPDPHGALRPPPLLLPAKFVPWIFPPCRSQLRPARPGAPQNPGESRGPPVAPPRRARAPSRPPGHGGPAPAPRQQRGSGRGGCSPPPPPSAGVPAAHGDTGARHPPPRLQHPQLPLP